MNSLFFIAFSVYPAIIYAQNLIPNPGFEERWECPANHTTRNEPIKAKYWYSPSQGTPDLFSSCAVPMVSTPRNFAGMAYPPEGNSYAGMYFGSPGQTLSKNYREYLTCKLEEGLLKGEVYHFQFYVKPATNSSYLINQISYAFSSDSVYAQHDNVLDLTYRSVLVDSLNVVNGWYAVTVQLIATGDERFLTIGDFTPPGEADFIMMGGEEELIEGRSTYYLFDNFSLKSVSPRHFITLELFNLRDLYFEFDSHHLQSSALAELKNLADYLKMNDNLLLKIFGSTDEKGTETYNERLSIKRAMAVKYALIELGVEAERLEALGKGEKEAISGYDSLNRKTEFLLLPLETQTNE